jgi:uncharacterized protein (UPF0261 family)
MSIAIIGMLDEREEALKYLGERIRARGQEVILLDTSIGVGGLTPGIQPHFSSFEIARRGGLGEEEARNLKGLGRERVTDAMARGLTELLGELHSSGKIRGALAVGGMTTSTISLPALKALPFGFPKVLVSSAVAMPAYATKFSQFLGLKDITVLNTVVDTVGMNPLVKALMDSACGIICGMVEGWEPIAEPERPTVAMTELGFCDKGAQLVRDILMKDGYEVISFHATGLGDRAAEELVAQGIFQCFVDLVPAGLSEHLLGGNRDAGPERLMGAVRAGVPYVLAPCGFDMISCGPIERRDKADPLWTQRGLAQRKLLVQDSMRVQARTTAQEMELIAKEVAQRLNKHPRKESVKFLVPLKGFSSLSVEGGPLHDPEADYAFVKCLRENLSEEIRVREVEASINEPAFAEAVAESVKEALRSLKA